MPVVETVSFYVSWLKDAKINKRCLWLNSDGREHLQIGETHSITTGRIESRGHHLKARISSLRLASSPSAWHGVTGTGPAWSNNTRRILGVKG